MLWVYVFSQQSTAGSRGGQWGWDDEDDEDMGAFDVPEVEYKVSDQISIFSVRYLTIIPRARVGYEVIDSERGA